MKRLDEYFCLLTAEKGYDEFLWWVVYHETDLLRKYMGQVTELWLSCYLILLSSREPEKTKYDILSRIRQKTTTTTKDHLTNPVYFI